MTEQPPIKNLKEVMKKWQQIIDEIQDTECGGETWDYLSEWSSEAGTAQYALWRGCQRIVKLSCEINEQINLIYPHPIKDCTATSAEKMLDSLIAWIKETKEMARDNLDRGYGTRGDRHVELILSQVLDKYAELQQQERE